MKDIGEMTIREYLSMNKSNILEEELTRPRVEIWPDEWAEWVRSHDKDGFNFFCHAEGRATPFCPIGLH
jgi:hypothetical protein